MLKKSFFITIVIFTIISLNSCSLDDKIESNQWQSTDRDDVNIIHKIWAQSIDKAVKIYIDSTTRAS